MVSNAFVRAPASERLASRDNNFDALRLTFSLGVVVGHSVMMPTNGPGAACFTFSERAFCIQFGDLARVCFIGFFAMSGYLVCGSYLESRSVWSYLWKRFLRIEPLFLIIAVLCILVVGPVGSGDPRAYFRDLDIGAQVRAIATLHLSPATAHTFPHNLSHLLNGPTWSLPLEVALYLLVALLGRAALLRLRWPVAITWIAFATLHLLIARFEPHWSKVPRFAQGGMQTAVPLYLAFVGGILIKLYPVLRKPPVVAVAAVLWLVGHLYGVGLLSGYVVAPAVMVWIGESRLRLPRPPDDLSYGLFLIAWPVQQLLLAFFALHELALLICTLAISLPMATLSWRFIERPALRLKGIDFRRYQRRSVTQSSAGQTTPGQASG